MPHHKNYVVNKWDNNADYHQADNKDHKHDYVDDNGSYQRVCYCNKCTKKWDDWCDKKKSEGQTHCKRKCYTICEYECEQPIHIKYKWGHKEKFEGEWEHHDKISRPDYCQKCKHKAHECTCNKKYY